MLYKSVCMCISGSRVKFFLKKSNVREKKLNITLLQKYPQIWETGPKPRKIWISHWTNRVNHRTCVHKNAIRISTERRAENKRGREEIATRAWFISKSPANFILKYRVSLLLLRFKWLNEGIFFNIISVKTLSLRSSRRGAVVNESD